MQAIPMTLRGAEKLREELDFLKSVRRPEIIAAIADAREHGDLKENAEYHAAREQQGFCEGRIKDIEAKLSIAQVIDITIMPNNGRVIFGSTVTVLNLDNDEEQTYRIVIAGFLFYRDLPDFKISMQGFLQSQKKWKCRECDHEWEI